MQCRYQKVQLNHRYDTMGIFTNFPAQQQEKTMKSGLHNIKMLGNEFSSQLIRPFCFLIKQSDNIYN